MKDVVTVRMEYSATIWLEPAQMDVKKDFMEISVKKVIFSLIFITSERKYTMH